MTVKEETAEKTKPMSFAYSNSKPKSTFEALRNSEEEVDQEAGGRGTAVGERNTVKKHLERTRGGRP